MKSQFIEQDIPINNLGDVAKWLRDRQLDGDEHLRTTHDPKLREQIKNIQSKFKRLADVVDAHIASEQS